MRVTTLEQTKAKLMGEKGTKHLLFEEESTTELALSVNRLKPNGPPGKYHLHTKSSSIYYILEGKARFVVNGEKIDLSKNGAMFIERNEPHSISNVSDEEALLLEVYSPGNPDIVEVKLKL